MTRIHKRFTVSLAFALIVAFAGSCFGQVAIEKRGNRIEEANARFSSNAPAQVQSALATYRELAAGGDRTALYNLGIAYLNGKGVKQSDQEAARLFQASAEKGYPLAQFNFAQMLMDGKVVPRDLGQAARWFKAAAENGHAVSQYNYGLMLLNGDGVERNVQLATTYLRRSADAGYHRALFTLGTMQRNGTGGQVDLPGAKLMYLKALAQGSTDALCGLGRISVEERDYRRAAEWYQKGVEKENSECEVMLGYLYGKGLGVPQSKERMLQLMSSAANRGNTNAQQFLNEIRN